MEDAAGDFGKQIESANTRNALIETIIGAAMIVHSELGPGLLESAYEACMAIELGERELQVERQKALPLRYRGAKLDYGDRLDLLVEEKVVVEVKGGGSRGIDPWRSTPLVSEAFGVSRWPPSRLQCRPPEGWHSAGGQPVPRVLSRALSTLRWAVH